MIRSEMEFTMRVLLAGVLAFIVSLTPTLGMAQPKHSAPSDVSKAAGPVELTDAQMDQVTGGALLDVTVNNNEILNDVNVGVNAAVAAGVAVAVLGAAGTAAGAAARQVVGP
jgi:hypothetical protein